MAPPNALLFGTGAIGSIYLYVLLQSGARVTSVCRSNYDAVAKNGLHIESEKFGNDVIAKPTHVVRSVDEAVQYGPFDYVLVTSKAFPGSKPSTAETIAPAVGSTTTIVLIQNGIAIEDEYRTSFPNTTLLSCVVYLPTTQTSPGRITMGALERLEIGSYPPSAAGRSVADKLAELLKKGGSDSEVHDDIQVKRWRKLLVNAPWNPICALVRLSDIDFMSSTTTSEAADFVLAVMEEVVTLAQACGYRDITIADAEYQLSRAKARYGGGKGVEPSMLADVKNGRAMEVEAILGNTVRLAREKGMKCVRLETLYILAKGLDAYLQKEREVLRAEEKTAPDGSASLV